MDIFVLVMFILMYVVIIALPKFKVITAGVTAVATTTGILIAGVSTFGGVFGSLDYNVLLMLLGIMLTVGMFSESGMPNKLADKMMSKIPNTLVAVILLCVLSGFISAFVDNVATVLMLAPIGLALARKANIPAIPLMIGIAVSSNLQGAATLIGDTTSIMLGSYADMNFFEFFVIDGKPSIFWAVELGALMTIPVLWFIFRKDKKKVELLSEDIKVTSIVPTILLCLNMAVLVCTSFLPDIVVETVPQFNGIVCMFFGLTSFIYYNARFKINPIKSCKKVVDYETILFLFFLFIVITAVEAVGIIDYISQVFIGLGNTNVFLLYTVIVFASVAISAFIDNIPYVATMLPVISGLCAGLPGVNPYLLYFGLLIGATLGGNLTPIGASANVVGIGILKKEGYKVKTTDFLRIGIPFTLVAVLTGYAFTWLVFGM